MNDDTDNLHTISLPKCPNIENITISIEGVEKLLDNINICKASGPDKIQNIILKSCSKEISPALANIFSTKSWYCHVTKWLEKCKYKPHFFKGNKHMASNYRPISLTSVCCKTLEHIICKHMLNHLNSNKIVSPLQHGFHNGHSCESQLILTMRDIMHNFDSKQQTDLLILDLSKAFDTVPYAKLPLKLHKCGISGNINKWIQSFMMHRKQQAIVEGEKISHAPLTLEYLKVVF